MKPFRVIALSGAAGSGKDTAAHFLAKRLGYATEMFAGPLKRGLCAMFGWAPEKLNDREWKETPLPVIGKSPRQMMQTLGTEWGRNLVHPHLWAALALEQCDRAEEAGFPGIVFTDCRFENEARLVLELGGHVIHISRPGLQPVAAHVSEQSLPSYVVSGYIVNDGSLSELGDKILDWVDGL